MNRNIKYPTLYQVNTRVWLTELSEGLGRKATLDDISDAALDRFKQMGFDWIWFLSVWTTGEAAKKVSRENPEWLRDFENTLPDLKKEDIAGSGFAIVDYKVHPDLGGDAALKRLRIRLKKRGLKLMLDFVPNHMAPDHGWVDTHPEFFISGTEADLAAAPQNYKRIATKQGNNIFAFGRDPYFSGWPDTVQIDYSSLQAVLAMKKELLRISKQCDGVRCDMAMLVLPEVFDRTWGRRAQSFWPEIIQEVKTISPEFCFMAEVYWDMEWDLQQLGFDYTYDKRLYDRLEHGNAVAVREHFYARLDFQNKMARFLENHDEPRAALSFKQTTHEAAAIITFFSPGFRFFHQGQFEGRLKRISPHLVRAPKEPVVQALQLFYSKLLEIIKNPVYREGSWQLLECGPAWHENDSYKAMIAFSWKGLNGEHSIIAVNYFPYIGQAYVRLPFSEFEGKIVTLKDLFVSEVYERDGSQLLSRGLYVELPAWGYHVFEVN